MSGKAIMAAMGNINDRYVIEFAEVKPLKNRTLTFIPKVLPLAACLCIVVIATILLLNPNFPHENQPGDITNSNVIWGNNTSDNIFEDYTDQAVKGTIIIAQSLKNAMIASDDKNDLFAVLVTELSGANPDDVYNTFVKPLNVKEEYLETGVIFVSQEQIAALECPSEFSLVLSLAAMPYEDKPITQEILNATEASRIKVKVYLKFNEYDILAQHKEALSNLSDEECARMQQTIISTEINRVLTDFLSDYGINDSEIEEKGIYIARFIAELDTALLSEIIEDERVELVLEAKEVIGADQIQ